MTVRAWAAALGALAMMAAGSVRAADCEVTPLVVLPVTMMNLVPTVEAKINGRPYQFTITSGSYFNYLGPEAAAEQKLKLEITNAYTIAGREPSFADVKNFTLSEARFGGVQFFVTQSFGSIAGRIGQNILGYEDVEYDLAHGVVRMFRTKGCSDKGMAYWSADGSYSFLDYRRADASAGRFRATGPVFVNGARLTAVFDTGSPGSGLTAAGARRAGLTPGASGGAMPIGTFKIGDEEIKNSKMRVFEIGGNAPYDMVVGADFFLAHRVYISKSQNRLYFTYNGGPVFNISADAYMQEFASQQKGSAAHPDTDFSPSDAAGYARRGAAFAAREDFERALADYDKAVALAPKEAGHLRERAKVRARNGQAALAADDMAKATALEPSNPETYFAAFSVRLILHDKTGAAQAISKAAALSGENQALRLRLAGAYTSLNMPAEAIEQYDLWLANDKGNDLQIISALNGRCWVKALGGVQLQSALNDCDRALRVAGRAANILDSRGLVHFRLGQYDKALADYNEALKSGTMPWSLYGRGLIELKKGAEKQGRADIAAAFTASPSLEAEVKEYGLGPPS